MLTAVYPPRAGQLRHAGFPGRSGRGSERLLLRLQSRCTYDNLRREWRDPFALLLSVPITSGYSVVNTKPLRHPSHP